MPQADSSPTHQLTHVADTFEEVKKHVEVDDNISHHSTEKVEPSPLDSSVSNEGEGHHVDMDETSRMENFEQEEPQHLTPSSSLQPTPMLTNKKLLKLSPMLNNLTWRPI